MYSFKTFQQAVNAQMSKMAKGNLHRVDNTKIIRDSLWNLYLASFPEGSNPKYQTRTEHDCQCCKQFIRNAGGMVSLDSGEIETIWDIDIGGPYQIVADALAARIRGMQIVDVFMHYERELGTQETRRLDGEDVITFDHFYFSLPAKFVHVKSQIPRKLNSARTNFQVALRGLTELKVDVVTSIIELVQQGTLYRGAENLKKLKAFLGHLRETTILICANEQSYLHTLENYVWKTLAGKDLSVLIRSSALGQLLIDMSDGMEMDIAVSRYEKMVAPENYKRPVALVTPTMIKRAQETVEELGLTGALQRRYAITTDVSINDVLFADRSVKKIMNPFDEIASECKVKPGKEISKVETVSIETFLKDIMPNADSLEVMLENNQMNNMVSLIAPMSLSANPLFKWDNNFSWTYNGDVTDSIKERVKAAGGSVSGDLRCSLAWFNYDDLDIHVIEPGGNRIYFSSKVNHMTGGRLDVDMNAGGKSTREAVENITWPNKVKMEEGTYTLLVRQYQKRESINVGFDMELAFMGDTYNFHYDKTVRGDVIVAKFRYSHKKGLELLSSIPQTTASKSIWGIATQTYVPVEMVMQSPNTWNNQTSGNKHWFFMLRDCVNPEDSRGFFNEYLKSELHEHRKVLEILGTKTKAVYANEQLSGIGFSSTQRNELLCRVSGAFKRVVKITF